MLLKLGLTNIISSIFSADLNEVWHKTNQLILFLIMFKVKNCKIVRICNFSNLCFASLTLKCRSSKIKDQTVKQNQHLCY